jgi:hypothetical protein
MDRHGRQTRLVEVGAAGGARIAAAAVDVCLAGVAADVAARYLAGAGVGTLRVGTERAAAHARAVDPAVRVEVDAGLASRAPASDSPLSIADASARAVGVGAHAALLALRRVLGVAA